MKSGLSCIRNQIVFVLDKLEINGRSSGLPKSPNQSDLHWRAVLTIRSDPVVVFGVTPSPF